MNLEDLIPKFEVGERVIVHYQPCPEAPCWNCGDIPHSNAPPVALQGEIIEVGIKTHCSKCGLPRNSDGWYGVRLIEPPFSMAGVPYTLLERVQVSR